jgi:signal transduction histidine kinase
LHSLGIFAETTNLSKKNILIINSYEPNNPWTANEESGVRAGLEGVSSTITIFHEYMDSKRIYGDTYDRKFLDYLVEKYKNTKIDVVITTDDYATFYVEKYRKVLIGDDVPVVFMGVNDITFEAEGFVGIYERINIKGTCDLIKTVHGKETPILIISDKTLTSVSIVKDVVATPEWLKENQIEVFIENDLMKIKQKLMKYNKGVIVMLLFNEDSKGNKYTYYEGLKSISDNTALPIYSTWEFYLNQGIVGGSLVTEKDMGDKASDLIMRLLNGEHISNLKSKETEAKNVLDYKIMSRFGIDYKMLEGRSDIINRPTNFWADYYQLMMLFVSVVVIFVIIIALLINNIRQKNVFYRTVGEHKNEIIQSHQKLEKRLAESIDKTKALNDRNIELLHIILALKKKVGFSERLPSILHEINGMLGNIRSRIDFLQIQSERLEKNEAHLSAENQFEEMREMLNESIVDCEMNMASTIHLISATKTCYSDLNEGEYRNYKVYGFIDAFWQMLKPTLKKKKVNFVMKVADDASLYGNPGDFLTVLAILFGNSIRHGYPVNSEQGLKIEIEAYSSQNYFHFIYRDDGEGCSTEKLEKGLQTSLETAALSGSGIGLYQLNYVVTTVMNGQINISGDEHEGIQVRINIPRAGERNV